MRYRELKIQTQREAPNNARSAGFAWLVCAGYLTRENALLPLGEQAIQRLRALSSDADFYKRLELEVLHSDDATYFLLPSGEIDVIYCPTCGYAGEKSLAIFKKIPFSTEAGLPLEKVATPNCDTIDSLAEFLHIPKEKTAKALMYTRPADGQFVFVVIRGDMTLSAPKLVRAVAEVRLASESEISKAGTVPGYASPIGLHDALIVVDDLIPDSSNLVAGANESGYHLRNTNCGRDYTAAVVADLVLATHESLCVRCGSRLLGARAIQLAARSEFNYPNILLALAESNHDDRGLMLPRVAAPFEIYLMHVPGKELDTAARAVSIYISLEEAGLQVLFDDRDERAGVKFNDADLIGAPRRVTVGEKALRDEMVELKLRTQKEILLVPIKDLISSIKTLQ